MKIQTMIEQAHAMFPPVNTIPAASPTTTAPAMPEPEQETAERYTDATLARLAQRYSEQGLYVVGIGGDGEGPFPEQPIRLIRLDHYRDLEVAFILARQQSDRLKDELHSARFIQNGQAKLIRFLIPALAVTFAMLLGVFCVRVDGGAN